jgi:hypothetical protein
LRDHHRFLIGQHLKTIEQIEATIAQFDARLEAALAPFCGAAERLNDLPGVSDNVAQTVIAEIGVDMNPFPTADHLLSFSRHESTARRKRRPKALEAPAQGRALAETRARPGGLGGDEGEKFQPQGAILQPQTAPSATRRRSSPSPPRCCASSAICSRTEPSTKTSDPITVERETQNARQKASPTQSDPSDSSSRSKRPHDPQRFRRGDSRRLSWGRYARRRFAA